MIVAPHSAQSLAAFHWVVKCTHVGGAAANGFQVLDDFAPGDSGSYTLAIAYPSDSLPLRLSAADEFARFRRTKIAHPRADRLV